MRSSENFTLYTIDTINEADKTYLNYLLNGIIVKLNERMKKKYVLLSLDRLKKSKKDEKFIATFFVMDKTDDSTHKLLASFTVKDDTIVIDEIREGYSLDMYYQEFQYHQEEVHCLNQKKLLNQNLDSTSLEYKEVKDMRGVNVAPLELNRDIPHPEATKLRNKNYVPFAGRKNKFEWDIWG